jgi:hypothetical protein
MAGALAIHRPGHHLRHVSKHHEGGRAVARLGGAYRAPANSEEARSRTYDPRRLALVKDHAVPIRPTRPTVTEISPIVRRRTSVTVPAGHHQAADVPEQHGLTTSDRAPSRRYPPSCRWTLLARLEPGAVQEVAGNGNPQVPPSPLSWSLERVSRLGLVSTEARPGNSPPTGFLPKGRLRLSPNRPILIVPHLGGRIGAMNLLRPITGNTPPPRRRCWAPDLARDPPSKTSRPT